MSPEECHEIIYLASDVWALGVTVLELARKHNPFEEFKGDELKEMIQRRTLTGLSESEFSPEIVDFVKKCLEKDAKKRWAVHQLMKVKPFQAE